MTVTSCPGDPADLARGSAGKIAERRQNLRARSTARSEVFEADAGDKLTGVGEPGKNTTRLSSRGGGALINQLLRFGVSVPRLGYVTVRRDQTIADEKSCAGDARANLRTLVGKSNLVDAVDVTNRISIPVQNDRRHGLLLLELLHLRGQVVNFFFKIVRRHALNSHGSVIEDHGHGAQKQQNSQDTLDHLLPSYQGHGRILAKMYCSAGSGSSGAGIVDLKCRPWASK